MSNDLIIVYGYVYSLVRKSYGAQMFLSNEAMNISEHTMLIKPRALKQYCRGSRIVYIGYYT